MRIILAVSRQRLIKKAVLAAAAAVILGSIFFFLFSTPGRPPEKAAEKALAATAAAGNFRYRVEGELLLPGRRVAFLELSGERFRRDCSRVKGKVMKTPVELYLLGSKVLIRDTTSGRWTAVEISANTPVADFIAEMDPLTFLRVENTGPVSYDGVEKTSRGKCWVFTFSPALAAPAVTKSWQFFTYRVWVLPRSGRVDRLEVRARSKEVAGNGLRLVVDLYDYGRVKPFSLPKTQ
ncbi:MAG: hypothetical protein PWQ91_1764 [Eubacteriales bacterium]|nr:hypothetical protein [Eubacteriales bacterium]MDN5364701.1 hypothetical protein [Eubacteriales bacterium]